MVNESLKQSTWRNQELTKKECDHTGLKIFSQPQQLDNSRENCGLIFDYLMRR